MPSQDFFQDFEPTYIQNRPMRSREYEQYFHPILISPASASFKLNPATINTATL